LRGLSSSLCFQEFRHQFVLLEPNDSCLMIDLTPNEPRHIAHRLVAQ
jgi:hypothetical protein